MKKEKIQLSFSDLIRNKNQKFIKMKNEKWKNTTKFFWLNMESKKLKITKMKDEKI